MIGVTTPTAYVGPISKTPRLGRSCTIRVEAKSIMVVSALPARAVPVRLTTLGLGPSPPFPSPPRGAQASTHARPSSTLSNEPPEDSSEEGMLYMGMKV